VDLSHLLLVLLMNLLLGLHQHFVLLLSLLVGYVLLSSLVGQNFCLRVLVNLK
jgi:hypothetical protein